MLRVLSFLLFISLFLACEPSVKFAGAMPPDIEPIESIPVNFHGTYMCESDSSRVYINPSCIVLESHYEFTTTVEEVEQTEDCSIVAGGLYLPGRKECIPFEYIGGDSIRAKVYELDTMVSFSDQQVVKSYKGHLFINLQNEEKTWSVWLLTPESDGSILFRSIDVPEDKDSIEAITLDYKSIEKDTHTIEYILNPTLIEFDRILEKPYISECDMLIPVNLEIEIFRN